MVVAAAFAADRSDQSDQSDIVCAHSRCLPYNSTLYTQHGGGIDRQFVRMVTDVYGAGGVMQQPFVRCIQQFAWRLMPLFAAYAGNSIVGG